MHVKQVLIAYADGLFWLSQKKGIADIFVSRGRPRIVGRSDPTEPDLVPGLPTRFVCAGYAPRAAVHSERFSDRASQVTRGRNVFAVSASVLLSATVPKRSSVRHGDMCVWTASRCRLIVPEIPRGKSPNQARISRRESLAHTCSVSASRW